MFNIFPLEIIFIQQTHIHSLYMFLINIFTLQYLTENNKILNSFDILCMSKVHICINMQWRTIWQSIIYYFVPQLLAWLERNAWHVAVYTILPRMLYIYYLHIFKGYCSGPMTSRSSCSGHIMLADNTAPLLEGARPTVTVHKLTL